MFTVAICDDEQAARGSLEEALHFGLRSLEVEYRIYSFLSGADLLQSPEEFTVIFLDIDMPDLNGIQTAQYIRQKNAYVPLIYVTNFPDWQNRAFRVHAFDYITKPYHNTDVRRVLQDVLQFITNTHIEAPAMVPFKTDKGVIRFCVDEIYYFESNGHNVRIVTKTGEYTSHAKIGDIEKMMVQHNFLMPHKSFVINLFFIRRTKGLDIEMENNETIPLSQKKTQEFRSRYGEYMRNTFPKI